LSRLSYRHPMGQLQASGCYGSSDTLTSNCCEACDSEDQFVQVRAHPLDDGVEQTTGSVSSKVGLGPDDNLLPPASTSYKPLPQIRQQQVGSVAKQVQVPYSEEALRHSGAAGQPVVRSESHGSNSSYQMATKSLDPDEERRRELDMVRSQAAALQRAAQKPNRDASIVTHYEEELRKLMSKIQELETDNAGRKRSDPSPKASKGVANPMMGGGGQGQMVDLRGQLPMGFQSTSPLYSNGAPQGEMIQVRSDGRHNSGNNHSAIAMVVQMRSAPGGNPAAGMQGVAVMR